MGFGVLEIRSLTVKKAEENKSPLLPHTLSSYGQSQPQIKTWKIKGFFIFNSTSFYLPPSLVPLHMLSLCPQCQSRVRATENLLFFFNTAPKCQLPSPKAPSEFVVSSCPLCTPMYYASSFYSLHVVMWLLWTDLSPCLPPL